MKRLIDLLSETELQGIINGDITLPIFTWFITDQDQIIDIQRLYFMQHSGQKRIQKWVETIFNNLNREDAWNALGKDLKSKFDTKWSKIAESLNLNYSPNIEYESEKRINSYKSNSANSTDISSYASGVEENGSDNVDTESSIYAFDSYALGSKTDKDVRTSGSENRTLKTGSDTFTKESFNESDVDDTHTDKGRNMSMGKLLTEEIDFRTRYIYYDIIMNDFDTLLTLQIY